MTFSIRFNMNKLPKLFFGLIGSALFFSACQQEVTPATDLPDISFNQKVMPIIASNCTASGCHGNENTEEFTLLTYDDVIKHGDVSAGDANGSKLYQVITSPIDGKVMPEPPNPPLTDEQTAQIYLWILQGAKNN